MRERVVNSEWQKSRVRAGKQGLVWAYNCILHLGAVFFFFLVMPTGMWDLSSPIRTKPAPLALKAWSLGDS